MDSIIAKFIAENITVSEGKRLMNKDVMDAWIAITGETTGRNKLYAAIYALHGVYKGQGFFTNVEFTPKEVKAVQEAKDVQVQAPGLTAFEQAQLEIQRAALESKERARRSKMEAEAKFAAEKAAAKAAKAETEAKLAREKMEADKIKAEAEAKLAREKMEAKREIAAEANAAKLELAKMKVAAAKDLMAMKLAEGERNREFQRVENNKSRALYAVSSYNRHLDPEVVGTVSKQYVTGDSLRRCIEFNAWDWAGDHNKAAMRSLKNTISSMEEKIEVVLDGKSVEKNVVEINAAIELTSKVESGVIPGKTVDDGLKLLDDIPVDGSKAVAVVDASSAVAADDIAGSQSMLLKRLVEVPKIAIRDEDRHMKTEFDWLVADQKYKKGNAKKLDKRRYIRNKKHASFGDNGNIFVKCDCCGVLMDMDKSGCHRGHNLPDARGGSWHANNIRLICASCNQNMSDKYTIREYKIKVLYIPITHDTTGADMVEDAGMESESDASSEPVPCTGTYSDGEMDTHADYDSDYSSDATSDAC